MINLTVDEIQLLHKKLIKATGGLSGIRDLGLLESAVYGAMQSFGDEEAYPEPEQRASRLAFANYTESSFSRRKQENGHDGHAYDIET